MTKAILVRKSDLSVVGGVIDTARPQWIVDPDTGYRLASPAVIGWESDDYRLCELEPLIAPEGKQIVGSLVRTYNAQTSKVIESATLEDRPAQRRPLAKRVIVERLHAADLLDAARQALDAAPLYDRERWNAREYIFTDDPTAIALVQSIGGDPAAILEVEQ